MTLVSTNFLIKLLMDVLEDLYADRTNIYVFTSMKAEGEGWDPVKLA